MDICRTPQKYFALALCIALMIVGRSSSFSQTSLSNDDVQHSVRQHCSMADRVFCVPNSFAHQLQSLVAPDSEVPPRIRIPGAKQPVFKQFAFFLPSPCLFRRGVPTLRSPPLHG